MELFTGFLWVLEGTIVFISLLLLFHLNAEGFNLKINLKINKYLYIIGIFFFFLIYSCFFLINNLEFTELQVFNINSLWDNYYEALYNININDFKLLYISYYKVNCIEFLLIGFLLLVGSIICVHINKYQKFLKIYKYNSIFKLFKSINSLLDFSFIRKQNLNYQTQHIPAIKIFKKK